MPSSTKKILFIYPHNFFEKTNGVNNMFYHFAKALSQDGFKVDLFSLKNFESKWEKDYPFDHKIVDQLFFYDVTQGNKPHLSDRLISRINRLLGHPRHQANNNVVQNLPDYTTPQMKLQLEEIIQKHKYSHIIIGYAYWANLLKDINVHGAQTIISINDWLTVQMKDYFRGNINITNFIKDEIDRINLFDIAIEISTFEHQLFSQLAPHPQHYLIPIFLETHKIIKSKKPEYDVAFIAHRNHYNIAGIKWFINEVMPLIPKTKVLIVGKVNTEIDKAKNKNITQVDYVENLNDVYRDSKAIICPLFGGTGLKVKIIEALSYGTPVVCTPQSLVGFPYDNHNGISIANSQIDFASQITRLISSPKILRQESLDAKKYFAKYFSIESATIKLKEIFKHK